MSQSLVFVLFGYFLGPDFRSFVALVPVDPCGFTLFLPADGHMLPPPLLSAV